MLDSRPITLFRPYILLYRLPVDIRVAFGRCHHDDPKYFRISFRHRVDVGTRRRESSRLLDPDRPKGIVASTHGRTRRELSRNACRDRHVRRWRVEHLQSDGRCRPGDAGFRGMRGHRLRTRRLPELFGCRRSLVFDGDRRQPDKRQAQPAEAELARAACLLRHVIFEMRTFRELPTSGG